MTHHKALPGILALFVAAIHASATPDPVTETAPITAQTLRAHLESLPTDRSIRGDDADLEGLERTAGLIERALTELGCEVQTQPVIWAPRLRPEGDEPVRSVESRNIWVDLPGTDLPGEVLVIAAHYDAVDGTPGADDNGTGVAAALEIARVLKATPLRRTVRILFPTAEEVGLVGARRYADEIAAPAIERGDERIVGVISLEMLGYFSDEPGSQTAPVKGLPPAIRVPDKGDFIAVVGILPHLAFHGPLVTRMQQAEPDLNIVSTGLLPAPTRDLSRSDHAAFWAIGVPAVMLTDTANFRNPNYHQPTDTIETLDFDRLTMVANAVAGAVRALAEPASAGDMDKEP